MSTKGKKVINLLNLKGLAKILFCLFLAGCFSYSFKGSGLPGIETIFIEYFQDSTNEAELGVKLTNSIIDKFTSDNTLKVVSEDKSQTKMVGKIFSITESPYTYDQSENVLSYKMTLNVEITFTDIFKEKQLWRQNFSEFGVYNVSGNPSRQQAIDDAIKKTTDLVFSQTFSGW
ncbi:LptE family protein [bacterium]|nr:LptE family protein [bacterium]